jgi:hypothetical protein
MLAIQALKRVRSGGRGPWCQLVWYVARQQRQIYLWVLTAKYDALMFAWWTSVAVCKLRRAHRRRSANALVLIVCGNGSPLTTVSGSHGDKSSKRKPTTGHLPRLR